jgi:hypothetical protein
MKNVKFKMKKMDRCNKKIMHVLKSCLVFIFTFFISHSYGQRDTTRRQTIDITSSYKPVLRNAVKINLSASPLAADTSRPRLAYNIPAQNLFFANAGYSFATRHKKLCKGWFWKSLNALH